MKIIIIFTVFFMAGCATQKQPINETKNSFIPYFLTEYENESCFLSRNYHTKKVEPYTRSGCTDCSTEKKYIFKYCTLESKEHCEDQRSWVSLYELLSLPNDQKIKKTRITHMPKKGLIKICVEYGRKVK